jgi:hypothetical protein
MCPSFLSDEERKEAKERLTDTAYPQYQQMPSHQEIQRIS